MSYTKVAKPTGGTYTRESFGGKYIWDDPNVSYDDPNVYWDGRNIAAYTDVSKPTLTGGGTIAAGTAMGFPYAMTYAEDVTLTSPDWTKVSKPS